MVTSPLSRCPVAAGKVGLWEPLALLRDAESRRRRRSPLESKRCIPAAITLVAGRLAVRKKHVLKFLMAQRSHFTPSFLSILLAALLFATLGMMSFSNTAKAAPAATDTGSRERATPELLPNGDFTRSTTGWRTNGTEQALTILSSTTDPIAQLTTQTTQNATLNDAPNVVSSTTEGTSYVATARVRTTTPDVNGALRIREVTDGKARSSQTYFRLTDTQWRTVELKMTTTFAQSHLDLNLVVWNLPVGRDLQVDWISLKEAAPTPVPVPPTLPTPPTQCDVAPPAGTAFGANTWTVGKNLPEALDEIDTAFGPVPIVRHFSPGMPFSWDSYQADLLRGRDLVVSFKVHPTAITSGQHDAFFRDWFASAPADQTIYWSYFHEPENNINGGEFTVAQYRAAWAHLDEIYDDACRPNMHSTLILTEWTMNPGSGRDYRTYDAGPGAVDMIAFDPYNGVWDPERDYYITPEALLDHIVEKMDRDGRPWGIAEIGSRISVGDNGAGRANWLRDIADYAVEHDATFVTYFHAIGNGDWRLNDASSRAAWRGVVQD